MKNAAEALLASFFGDMKKTFYFPKVRSDRWGNRGKYIPTGPNKNLKAHNV